MRLTDFLVEEATVDDLVATEKVGAILELVEALKEVRKIKPAHLKSVVEAIMERESLGTTGIGRGVAVPHAKHPSIDTLVGVVGRSKKGISFSSLDGQPVYIIVLLVSPVKDQGPKLHLKALEHVSRLIRNETYLRFLRNAASKEELIRLIREEDQEIVP